MPQFFYCFKIKSILCSVGKLCSGMRKGDCQVHRAPCQVVIYLYSITEQQGKEFFQLCSLFPGSSHCWNTSSLSLNCRGRHRDSTFILSTVVFCFSTTGYLLGLQGTEAWLCVTGLVNTAEARHSANPPGAPYREAEAFRDF